MSFPTFRKQSGPTKVKDSLSHDTYPLFKHLLPNHLPNTNKVLPTFSLRLLRARLSRILRPQWTSFYTPSKSRVLYADDEPTASSKYTATHDVCKLPIFPNDFTLVRPGDAFEISIVGFCIPSHRLVTPKESRRLLYSIHGKGAVSHPNYKISYKRSGELKPLDESECRVHYDDYVYGTLSDNSPQPYTSVPASRSLYARVNEATPREFPVQIRILETGSVGDVHSRVLQSLSTQDVQQYQNQISSDPTNEADVDIETPKFLPHVSAAIEAASVVNEGTASQAVPPQLSAALSATFCVTAERESHPIDDKFGICYEPNFEPPIPLRYGYFILFEKNVKNRVYVNTQTSDFVNPLTIFNVPLENVCYVILRVTRGVTDIPLEVISCRHKQDGMRVESLLQLGEAIRLVNKLQQ